MEKALISSDSSEYGTPAEWCLHAHATMGGIDLDPASTEHFNKCVGASTFYDASTDGLTREWRGRVFLNPPGGKGNPNPSQRFFRKLMQHFNNGDVSEFVYLGFQLGQLPWVGRGGLPASAVLAIPHKRIAFINAQNKKDPTHGNFFLYAGPNSERFATVFGADCAVYQPWRR